MLLNFFPPPLVKKHQPPPVLKHKTYSVEIRQRYPVKCFTEDFIYFLSFISSVHFRIDLNSCQWNKCRCQCSIFRRRVQHLKMWIEKNRLGAELHRPVEWRSWAANLHRLRQPLAIFADNLHLNTGPIVRGRLADNAAHSIAFLLPGK